MADINAAWRALSDPGRRAMYDASLRALDGAGPFARSVPVDRLDEERYPVAPRSEEEGPPRFPFGLIAFVVLGAMVIGFVMSGLSNRTSEGPAVVDPIIRQGDCVVIEPNADARKVACDQPFDGIVTSFVPFDATCPFGTSAHRDRQGMGVACVTFGSG
jgi:molecular chaperone DnaJ